MKSKQRGQERRKTNKKDFQAFKNYSFCFNSLLYLYPFLYHFLSLSLSHYLSLSLSHFLSNSLPHFPSFSLSLLRPQYSFLLLCHSLSHFVYMTVSLSLYQSSCLPLDFMTLSLSLSPRLCIVHLICRLVPFLSSATVITSTSGCKLVLLSHMIFTNSLMPAGN